MKGKTQGNKPRRSGGFGNFAGKPQQGKSKPKGNSSRMRKGGY